MAPPRKKVILAQPSSYKRNGRSDPFKVLPYDLLIQILTNLPFLQIFRLQIVSKHWNQTLKQILDIFARPTSCFSERWLLMPSYDEFYCKWDITAFSDKSNNIFRFSDLPISKSLLMNANYGTDSDSQLMEVISQKGLIFCLFAYRNPLNIETTRILQKIRVVNALTGHVKELTSSRWRFISPWSRRFEYSGWKFWRESWMRIAFDDDGSRNFYVILNCDRKGAETESSMVLYDSAKETWKQVSIEENKKSAITSSAKVLLQGNFFFCYKVDDPSLDRDANYYLVLAYKAAEDTWSKVRVKKDREANKGPTGFSFHEWKIELIHKCNGRLLACVSVIKEHNLVWGKRKVCGEMKVWEMQHISDDTVSPVFDAIWTELSEFSFPKVLRYPHYGGFETMAFADGHLICFTWMHAKYFGQKHYKRFKLFLDRGYHRPPPVVYDIREDRWQTPFPSDQLEWLKLDHQRLDCTSFLLPWQSIS